jgi:hypothetical protein
LSSSPSSPPPPSRSATYASLPTRGRRRDGDDDGGEDAYGPLGNSSPIPLSLRQRASAAEPLPAGMAMLTSPPRQRKTELVYRVVLVQLVACRRACVCVCVCVRACVRACATCGLTV